MGIFKHLANFLGKIVGGGSFRSAADALEKKIGRDKTREAIAAIGKSKTPGDLARALKDLEDPPPGPRVMGGGDRVRARRGIAMIEVSSSSNVHSYGYDETSRTLQVRFLGGEGEHRSGPGPMYHYFHVKKEVFQRMKAAVSKGTFIWDELRKRGSIFDHKYDYTLVGVGAGAGADAGGLGDEYVPRKATASGFKPREIKVGSKVYTSSRPGTGIFRGEGP